MNKNTLPETQPINQVVPEDIISEPNSSSIRWVNILSIAILGLIVVLGAVYAGFYLGKKQAVEKLPVSVQPQDNLIIEGPPSTNPTTQPNPVDSNNLTTLTIPSDDPSDNWETYTNSTYNFFIKHPSNWISKKYSSSDNRIPYLKNPDNNYGIHFSYIKDDPSVINEMSGRPMVTDLSDYNPTIVNGITVYVNNNLQGDDGNYMKYYFQISEGEYISILTPLTNGPLNIVWEETTVSLAKQIISTFEFTNNE
jgi:hypothetical protein